MTPNFAVKKQNFGIFGNRYMGHFINSSNMYLMPMIYQTLVKEAKY